MKGIALLAIPWPMEAPLPKLTDMQMVILTAAAGRAQGRVLPLPRSLPTNKGARASVLRGLLKKGLIEECPQASGDEVWREEADGERVTLAITGSGLAAIGVGPEGAPGGATGPVAAEEASTARRPRKLPAASAGPSAKSGTKQALLIDLLKRKKGAALSEIVEATGWQPHSVRGAISGSLKKKLGLSVISEQVQGRGRVYRIVEGH